jgi:type IV pilus assembly protein PilA
MKHIIHSHTHTHRKNKGFTLIEILVVIGIIAILAAIVIVAINPSRQFAQARNSQRTSNVETLINAIGQNIADNKGIFNCGTTTLPATATFIASASSSPVVDLRPCLVPTYISEIPVDPTIGVAWNNTSYFTGYMVMRDATTSRITISAPQASTTSELNQVISLTR